MQKKKWLPVAIYATACLVTSLVLAVAGCGGDSSDDDGAGSGPLSGVVLSAEGTAIAGATVYLIPTAAINTTAITATTVRDGTAEAYDEPLEDAIATGGPGFAQTTTDGGGGFSISVPDGSYFVYVAPPVADVEHLPGGNYCRTAYNQNQLRGAAWTIKLSSQPSGAATYIGGSTCLTCHAGYANEKKTAHKNGIMLPRVQGPRQDRSNYPDWFDGIDKFVSAGVYTSGTKLTLGDYPVGTGFDKFDIAEAGDTYGLAQIATPMVELYLWKNTGDGKYYVTAMNVAPGNTDPNDPWDIEVKFTYGGGVGKQRFLVDPSVAQVSGGAGGFVGARSALYYTLQYNIEGSTVRRNRAKRVWRDYKFSNFWNSAGSLLKLPGTTDTFQAQCGACHITGYEPYVSGTGDIMARGADDVNGEANIDDDPSNDEINISCETCHGPGSEHQAAASARYIVRQASLPPERQNVTCGRCHDRPKGKSFLGVASNEQVVNTGGFMMRPGGKRSTFLSDYCSATQKGPTATDVWADDVHSKSHHQQYSDFLKSKHYRNDRKLVVCADCHDVHGNSSYRNYLKADPDDNNSTLCQTCHTKDTLTHLQEKTGNYMLGSGIHCTDCHLPKTATSGSGRYGQMVIEPLAPGFTYTDSTDEENSAYWEGDISSHNFKIPLKTHVSVAGQKPGKAMPIPYTRSCGTCHDVSQLQYP